jgi:hypothetical protein
VITSAIAIGAGCSDGSASARGCTSRGRSDSQVETCRGDLVGEEHEHVAIAGVEGRVGFVDGDLPAEDARHAPMSRDAVAETLDQGVDHILIPDAAVAGTGGGAELDIIALAGDQQLDVFDPASEAQVEVEAVGDDRGRQSAVADWARDESCPIVRD